MRGRTWRAARAGAGLIVVAALSACAPQPPADAGVPRVPCGGDAGAFAVDPCARWGVCEQQGAWSGAYTGGTCGDDGYCVFPNPPTWQHCTAGCFNGPIARCTNPGPTRP